MSSRLTPASRSREKPTGCRRAQNRRRVLWCVSVETSAEAEDAVTVLLTGTLGPSISSYNNMETGRLWVTSFLESRRAWSRAARERVRGGLRRIHACGLSLGRGTVMFRKLPRKDWAEAWRHHFKPLRVGSSLIIRPSWSRLRRAPDQRVLILDPGLSFGTGRHPTTRFCLLQLAAFRAIYPRASLLDLGTGSGILALAAAKLGYAPVTALDFDKQVVAVARANARRNRLLGRIELRRRDVSRLSLKPKRHYTEICANLLTPLLVAQRRRIVAQLHRRGSLILAGILKEEFESVRTAYEEVGLKLMEKVTEEEWCSGRLSACADRH